MSYGARNGVDDLAVLYTDNVPGQVGRNAIQSAASRNGARVVAAEGYQLNAESLSEAISRVRPLVDSDQAEALFLTDTWEAGLSVVLQLGPDQGLSPDAVQYMGLTRWDTRPDGFNLPGIEGAGSPCPRAAPRNPSRAATRAPTAPPRIRSPGSPSTVSPRSARWRNRDDPMHFPPAPSPRALVSKAPPVYSA